MHNDELRPNLIPKALEQDSGAKRWCINVNTTFTTGDARWNTKFPLREIFVLFFRKGVRILRQSSPQKGVNVNTSNSLTEGSKVDTK